MHCLPKLNWKSNTGMPGLALKLNIKESEIPEKDSVGFTCICLDIAVVADIFFESKSERIVCYFFVFTRGLS